MNSFGPKVQRGKYRFLVVDSIVKGRPRRRLELARQKGYLDATCRDSQPIVQVYGLWCWRLKIPLVWFERMSPRSRYGRLHLEMFTTGNTLTEAGQAALMELGAHDARWDRVPLRDLERLAHQAYRIATRAGNAPMGGGQGMRRASAAVA